MLLILICLGAGMALGGFVNREPLGRVAVGAQSIGLYLLIFFMGAEIGLSSDILTDIVSIGWRALVIALAAILGSVLCAQLPALLGRRREP